MIATSELKTSERALHEHYARIGKAVSSARRVELLTLLEQGERSVEALAEAASLSVTNTSQHLQVLRAAHLVETRRDGTRVLYRLAGEDVSQFIHVLRELAQSRLAEVEQVLRHSVLAIDELEPISREELLKRVKQGEVVVLDVRPHEEYLAGHIEGAVSVPLDELERRLETLDASTPVVAYCRGPYCLLAPQAAATLRERGFSASRLEDGFPEWRLAQLPIAAGDDS